MNISIVSQKLASLKSPLAVVFVTEERARLGAFRQLIRRSFGEASVLPLSHGDFNGKELEASIALLPTSAKVKRLLYVGLGNAKTVDPERFRKAAAVAVKKTKSLKIASAHFLMLSHILSDRVAAYALAEGALLSDYSFDKYKTKKENGAKLETLTFLTDNETARGKIEPLVRNAETVANAVCRTRDLANAPGSEIYPESLASVVKSSAEQFGYSVKILSEQEIRDAKMGGVIAVAAGSARPPRFMVLQYGKQYGAPVVLVGKGVTFDSGGISIKPSAGMSEMKMDMSGAAAVVGTFEAIAQLRQKVHLIGLIPAVENMPGGKAFKPGDIITHRNGKTSEVDNTDAEGRLILADALSYAEQFKPAVVIDLATLTGACVVALGHIAAGMMGNDEATMQKLKRSGDRVFERVWQLPMYEEYARFIKSDVADVKNVGGRWAGTITAAHFLRNFIGTYKWVHLDIAGTAMLEEPGEYTPRGGSGFGVRLLVDFLQNRK